MQMTADTLRMLNTVYNSAFQQGFKAVSPIANKIAMMVKSSGRDEAYGWLRDLPNLREWLGDRIIYGLQNAGYLIENRKFEMTVRVQRTDIEDDRVGTYKPLFDNIGRRTAQHPDKLLAELILSGWNTNCWDGQYFFDTDHPVGTETAIRSVSNMQAGAGPAWYLLDLSQAIRPFIYQERTPFVFQSLDKDSDNNVFWRDEYIYGVRGRSNAGFGLWQLAYGSKATLDPTNFEAARIAMNSQKDDQGQPLGIMGTTLLVPVALEGNARKILKNTLGANGETNSWVDSAELIVSPWLS